jgi:hypothetical protein
MKKLMTIFGVILVASTILTSCGGSKKKENNEVTIKPKSTSIKGELGDYFEVVDKEYIIKVEEGSFMGGGMISVEVKRTDKDFNFSTDKINPFGTNGGEDYHVGFGIELLGESGPITVKQATEGGMGGPYSSEDVTGLMKLKKGETGYIRWSVDKLDGLKSFQLSSALQKEEHSSEASDASDASGDCEQFCSDYEAFADEYVAFIKKYKANPTDPTILSEYSEMVSKAAEMQESSKDCSADAKVAARISKALSKIAKAAM